MLRFRMDLCDAAIGELMNPTGILLLLERAHGGLPGWDLRGRFRRRRYLASIMRVVETMPPASRRAR
jgi:hypothetical protein